MRNKITKTLIIGSLVVLAGVFGYFAWQVYRGVAQERIEKEIKEAGLDPADYDLRGVAPWNVRDFVTSKEIEKAGLNPKNFDIQGDLTADEARREVTRQEIARQLAEYDLSIDDVDLSGIDLLSLSAEEIRTLITKKVTEKLTPKP